MKPTSIISLVLVSMTSISLLASSPKKSATNEKEWVAVNDPAGDKWNTLVYKMLAQRRKRLLITAAKKIEELEDKHRKEMAFVRGKAKGMEKAMQGLAEAERALLKKEAAVELQLMHAKYERVRIRNMQLEGKIRGMNKGASKMYDSFQARYQDVKTQLAQEKMAHEKSNKDKMAIIHFQDAHIKDNFQWLQTRLGGMRTSADKVNESVNVLIALNENRASAPASTDDKKN